MGTLAELKETYPQYANMPDGELAWRLWNKSYKGKIPMGLYADQIDLSDDGFTGMVQAAEASGYRPTSQTIAEGVIPPASKTRAAFQGFTLGAGDEIVGGLAALGEKVMGSDRPMGDLYSQYTENERAQLRQYQQERPVGAIASEIGGAIVNPAGLVRAPGLIAKAPAAVRAATTAGTQGGIYGFMAGEGGAVDRAQNAVEVAIPSAIFGGALQQTMRLSAGTARRVSDAFKGSNVAPTLETLRDTKNAMYTAVDQSGLNFTSRDMLNLYSRSHRSAVDASYVPEVDRQTFAALKMIEAQRGKSPTIGELDKLRQGLWKRYEASGGSEIAIRDMIDHVDEIIESAPATNELMQAARLANSRYKKAELLEEAFDRANRQVQSTGSGGNILNKYRQAVTAILNNPNKSKWFNADEKQQMESFISGSWGENVMRRIGKLSPSGNGLMLALNIGAIAADPSMMAITAAATGSKAISDAMSGGRAQALRDTVARGSAPVQIPYLPGTGGAAAGAGEAVREYRTGQGPRR